MFINDYIQIVETIKSGGMSNIFIGVDLASGRPVVIKELKSGYFKNEYIKIKFLDEANRYLYLNHPNIVELIDFIDMDDRQFLVMEHIDGYDLVEYMSRISGPLSLEGIASIVNEVSSALNFVHNRNLVHLDVKPSNIMITKGNRVKLIDFGIAHEVKMGSSREVIGTPHYMSPEQMLEDVSVDLRSDVYSLGVTIFEMLTGRPPFSFCKTREQLYDAIQSMPIPEAVPFWENDKCHKDKINKIIQKATAKDVEDRYQNCEELQIELIDFL